MKNKIVLSCLPLLCALFLGLSAVQGAPVTISWSVWPASQDTVAILEEMARGFEALHPDIKVELNIITGSYTDAILTRMAGGEDLDVIQAVPQYMIDLAEGGALANLEQFYASDRGFNISLYYPQALATGKWKGVQYGIPAHAHTHALFYNKDLFDQSGVSYPDNTWNWDTFLAAAKKLTKQTGDMITQFGCEWSGYFSWYVMYQSGTQLLNESGTAMGITTDTANAWQWLASLRWEHHVVPRPGESGSFFEGTAAMMWGGHWTKMSLRNSVKFDWDVEELPYGLTRGTILSPALYTIYSRTKHPRESWELVKYLTYNPGMLALVKGGEIIPVVRNATLLEAFMSVQPPFNNQAFLNSFAYAYPEGLPHPKSGQIMPVVNNALNPVWEGQRSAKEAMDMMIPAVNAILQEK
jgi:multiple sugar transport system substrate-binding protein